MLSFVQLFGTPMDYNRLSSSVHGIGIEPGSPALVADSLLSEPPGKLYLPVVQYQKQEIDIGTICL